MLLVQLRKLMGIIVNKPPAYIGILLWRHWRHRHSINVVLCDNDDNVDALSIELFKARQGRHI